MPLTTGATLPLPAGFEGFVVRKAPANAGEDAGRTWQTDGRFSKITCVTYSGDECDGLMLFDCANVLTYARVRWVIAADSDTAVSHQVLEPRRASGEL